MDNRSPRQGDALYSKKIGALADGIWESIALRPHSPFILIPIPIAHPNDSPHPFSSRLYPDRIRVLSRVLKPLPNHPNPILTLILFLRSHLPPAIVVSPSDFSVLRLESSRRELVRGHPQTAQPFGAGAPSGPRPVVTQRLLTIKCVTATLSRGVMSDTGKEDSAELIANTRSRALIRNVLVFTTSYERRPSGSLVEGFRRPYAQRLRSREMWRRRRCYFVSGKGGSARRRSARGDLRSAARSGVETNCGRGMRATRGAELEWSTPSGGGGRDFGAGRRAAARPRAAFRLFAGRMVGAAWVATERAQRKLRLAAAAAAVAILPYPEYHNHRQQSGPSLV
ncbi:Protein of unknown function [Gryllus bimaculatus]|nr:Protein of unknown function [Gryllus bimaculatus]